MMRFQMSLVFSSTVPHLSLQPRCKPCAITMTFIKTVHNTNNSDLAPTPVVALILSRLFSSPCPLTWLFLFHPLFFWTTEWPLLSRRRSGESAPGHAVLVAALRRGSEGSAPSALSPPPPSRRSKGSAPATLPPLSSRKGNKASALFAPSTFPLRRRSLPFPPPPVSAQRRDPSRDAATDCY